MTENEHEPEHTPSREAGLNRETASNYFTWLMGVLRKPDAVFTDDYRGQKLFGLISLVALVVIIAFAAFVNRAMYGSVSFSDLLNGIKVGLAYAIPLAAVVLIWPWYAGMAKHHTTLDTLLEKFGAAVVPSAVLILIAIPLELLKTNLAGWFQGAGHTLIYVAVFFVTFTYVAPRKLAPATIFVIGFYFAYRLVNLIL